MIHVALKSNVRSNTIATQVGKTTESHHALQGRLTLLLGPPGAGKTTLLKALSGKMRRDKSLKVQPAHALFGLGLI